VADMKDIERFLDDYSLIESEKNFFQIAGFPHYENVSSNVLSFLLKFPLVLKLFLNCVRLKDKSIINYDISNDKINDITREEITKEKKRIDIVVKTNNYVIIIENKIEASAKYNPYDSYDSHRKLLEGAKGTKKEAFLIVLLKNKQSVKEIDGVKKVNGYILYKDFSVELKNNYSKLLDHLGHRYFFILTEYISNIDFLEGEHFMNEDFVNIARGEGNLDKIQQIMHEGERLRYDLRNLVREIINELQEYGKLLDLYPHEVPKEFWSVAKFQDGILSKKEEYDFVIDVLVNIYGFTISIYDKHKEIEDQEKRLNDILPKFEYVISNSRGDGPRSRAYYKDIIERKDNLIKILKEILDSFANLNNQRK